MKRPFISITAMATLLVFFLNTLGADMVLAADNRTVPNKINTMALNLPGYLGTVADSWKGLKEKTVILIQDAHCNYEAQKKISDIISYLNSNYNINTINLEGGARDYDLTLFTNIGDRKVREKTADYFVKEGVLNGAEYFAVNNPEKVMLWGIEKPEFYINNLKVYRESLGSKDDRSKIIARLSAILAGLKLKVYSKELLEFDIKRAQYKSGELGLKEYMGSIIEKACEKRIDFTAHKNLKILGEVLNTEKGVDFKKAGIERDALIERLQRRLSSNGVKDLIKVLIEFKSGKVEEGEFYTYLDEKSRFVNIPTSEYPELKKYRAYLQAYESIDKTAVIDELQAAEELLYERLCGNRYERELNRLACDLGIIKDIFNISLTRKSYDYYRENEKYFSMDGYLSFIAKVSPGQLVDGFLKKELGRLDAYRKEMAKFYELSFKRDEAFVTNLKFENVGAGFPRPNDNGRGDRAPTIIVTGGFHTENLCAMFKKEGISYISIMPNFTNPEGYECPYLHILSGEKNLLIKDELPKVTSQALATCSQATSLFSTVAASNVRTGEGTSDVSSIPSGLARKGLAIDTDTIANNLRDKHAALRKYYEKNISRALDDSVSFKDNSGNDISVQCRILRYAENDEIDIILKDNKIEGAYTLAPPKRTPNEPYIIFIRDGLESKDAEQALEHEKLEIKWLNKLKGKTLPTGFSIGRAAHVLAWAEQIYKNNWEKVEDCPFLVKQLSDLSFDGLQNILNPQKPREYSHYMFIGQKLGHEVLRYIERFERKVRERAYELLQIHLDPKLSPKAVSIAQKGVISDIYLAHDMAVKDIVNPEDKDGLVGVYGCSGADVSNFLLSTNCQEAYFVDRKGVSADKLNEILNDKTAWDLVEAVSGGYRAIKKANGFITAGNNGINDVETMIISELKGIGVKRNDIISVDDEDGSPRISFKWAYPGVKRKTYKITFVQADVVNELYTHYLLKKVLKEKIDIYYQRAAYFTAESYSIFLPALASSIREGGYLVTDDKYLMGIDYMENNPDDMLEKAGLAITKKGEITSDELERCGRNIIVTRPIRGQGWDRYGWDVEIRRKTARVLSDDLRSNIKRVKAAALTELAKLYTGDRVLSAEEINETSKGAIEALADSDIMISRSAADALEALFYSNHLSDESLDENTRQLISLMANSSRNTVISAASILSNLFRKGREVPNNILNDRVNELLELIASPNYGMKAHAVSALIGFFRSNRVLPEKTKKLCLLKLVDLLNDSDDYVSAQAATAIGAMMRWCGMDASMDAIIKEHMCLKSIGLKYDAGAKNLSAQFAKGLLCDLTGAGTVKLPQVLPVRSDIDIKEIPVLQGGINKIIPEGYRFLRAQGRTLVFVSSEGAKYLGLKLLKRTKISELHSASMPTESPSLLDYESRMFGYIDRNRSLLNLSGRYPVPHLVEGHTVFRIHKKDIGSAAETALKNEMDKAYEEGKGFYVDTSDDCYTAMAYETEPEYFEYLSDPGIPEETFRKALSRDMHDLFALARFGIIHTALIEIFHTTIETNTRPDSGKYMWMIDILRPEGIPAGAGRLHAWPAAVKYPNPRVSAIADLSDIYHISELATPASGVTSHMKTFFDINPDYNPEQFYLASYMGDYLLSIVLIMAKRFREKGSLDWKRTEELADLLRRVYVEAFSGFTGRDSGDPYIGRAAGFINWERFAAQVAFFMAQGNDYAEYLQKKNIPEKIFGHGAKIAYENDYTLSTGWSDGPGKRGWYADRRNPDLGPINGPLVLQELVSANYLFTSIMIEDLARKQPANDKTGNDASLDTPRARVLPAITAPQNNIYPDYAREAPWDEAVRHPEKDSGEVNHNQQRYYMNQLEVREYFVTLLMRLRAKEPYELEDFKKDLGEMHRILMEGRNGRRNYVPEDDLSFGAYIKYREQSDSFRKLQDPWDANNRCRIMLRLLKEVSSIDTNKVSVNDFLGLISELYIFGIKVPYLYFRVNNSLCMNMLNGLLRAYGLRGIPHGELDFEVNKGSLAGPINLREELTKSVMLRNPSVKQGQKLCELKPPISFQTAITDVLSAEPAEKKRIKQWLSEKGLLNKTQKITLPDIMAMYEFSAARPDSYFHSFPYNYDVKRENQGAAFRTSDVKRDKGVRSADIRQEMLDFLTWLKEEEEKISPDKLEELAAEAYLRFIVIGPFEVGNNMAGRFLLDAIFLRSGKPTIDLRLLDWNNIHSPEPEDVRYLAFLIREAEEGRLMRAYRRYSGDFSREKIETQKLLSLKTISPNDFLDWLNEHIMRPIHMPTIERLLKKTKLNDEQNKEFMRLLRIAAQYNNVEVPEEAFKMAQSASAGLARKGLAIDTDTIANNLRDKHAALRKYYEKNISRALDDSVSFKDNSGNDISVQCRILRYAENDEIDIILKDNKIEGAYTLAPPRRAPNEPYIIFIKEGLEDKDQEQALEHEKLEVKWLIRLQPDFFLFGMEIERSSHILAWAEQIHKNGWARIEDCPFLVEQLRRMSFDELKNIAHPKKTRYELHYPLIQHKLRSVAFNAVQLFEKNVARHAYELMEKKLRPGLNDEALKLTEHKTISALYLAHDMAVKDIINPDNKDELVGVYGCSGADVSNFLLSTNCRNAYFVDMKAVSGQELHNIWQDVSLWNAREDRCRNYRTDKYMAGYAVSGRHGIDDVENKIISEIKGIGVSREDIVYIGEEDGAAFIIFKWRYPGRDVKEYKITFINADIRNKTMSSRLQKILNKGIDIYYQRAGFTTPYFYSEFIGELASHIREGGYMVTDDRYLKGEGYAERNPDPLLSGAGLDFTKKGEITSSELVRCSRNIIKARPRRGQGCTRYGWDVEIRKRFSTPSRTDPHSLDFPRKRRDRSGHGMIGGVLNSTEKAYGEYLFECMNNKGLTRAERDAVINALLRIKEGGLEARPELFSPSDVAAVLSYRQFNADVFIEKLLLQRQTYESTRDSNGKPVFTQKDIFNLLFTKLMPVRLILELMGDNLSKKKAIRVLTGWADYKTFWMAAKSVREELIADGLGNSDATAIVLGWSDPINFWQKAKAVRDGLINEGLSKSEATLIVLTWADPKAFWEDAKIVLDELRGEGLSVKRDGVRILLKHSDPMAHWQASKPIRDELMADGLSKGEATKIVIYHSDPKGFWRRGKPLADILMADGLSRKNSVDIVISHSDPLGFWQKAKVLRDKFMREGFSKNRATCLVMRWSDPEGFWRKAKPVRDRLVKEGLSMSEATSIIISRSDPQVFWHRAKRVRDELMREGLSKTYATSVVLKWRHPKEEWLKAKIVRDELCKDGLNITEATHIALFRSDPKTFWKRAKPIRDELVADGLSKTEAMRMIIGKSDPTAFWRSAKPIRDEIMANGVQKSEATLIVIEWANPMGKFNAIKVVTKTLSGKLKGLSDKAIFSLLLRNSYKSMAKILNAENGFSEREAEIALAPLCAVAGESSAGDGLMISSGGRYDPATVNAANELMENVMDPSKLRIQLIPVKGHAVKKAGYAMVRSMVMKTIKRYNAQILFYDPDMPGDLEQVYGDAMTGIKTRDPEAQVLVLAYVSAAEYEKGRALGINVCVKEDIGPDVNADVYAHTVLGFGLLEYFANNETINAALKGLMETIIDDAQVKEFRKDPKAFMAELLSGRRTLMLRINFQELEDMKNATRLVTQAA